MVHTEAASDIEVKIALELARQTAFAKFGVKNTELCRQAYTSLFNGGEGPIVKSAEIVAREPDVTLRVSLLFFIFLVVPLSKEREIPQGTIKTC